MKKASFKAMILILLAFAASAVAQTFYFMPPMDPEWMRRTPNIVDLTNDNSSTPMKVDPDGCGWFKIDISGSQMGHEIVVWPGKYNSIPVTDETPDRIGINGLDEGPDAWTGSNPKRPEPINFSAVFGNFGSNNVFFDPSKGAAGWGTDRGTPDPKRCTYKMAGLIYDTDPSVLYTGSGYRPSTGDGDIWDTATSFTRYSRFPSIPANQNASWMGLRRGIVQPTLTKNERGVPKMQWNSPSGDAAAHWTERDFNTAFTCTEGKNALVCYDIPFARDSKGLWTFASDYLCSDETLDIKPEFFTSQNARSLVGSLCSGRSPMLSFAPDVLNGRNGYTRGDNNLSSLGPRNNLGNCTYAACPDCHKSNPATKDEWGDAPAAEPVTPFIADKINTACYEKGLKSTSNTSSCGDPYGNGDFNNGNTPEVWHWDSRNDIMRPRMESSVRTSPNSFFCFETHATFVYEQGQEFYFSGDDDIWVFIDNNLVIDIGGCHLATPGYVALDSIGKPGRWQGSQRISGNNLKPSYDTLKEGKEYPIDIFFCDRRSNASNIRISTNMYIKQESGIFVDGDAKGGEGAKVCVQQSGSGTCDALLGGGSSGGSSNVMCGDDASRWFEFYIISRNNISNEDARVYLDLRNPDICQAVEGGFECYGGINVWTEGPRSGRAYVNQSKLVNFPVGTQYLYVKVRDEIPGGKDIDPERVATITTQTFARTAWGEIREEDNRGKKLTDVVCQQNPVAATGELVPICFSSGEPAGDYFYTGPVSEIIGQTLKLNTAGFLNSDGQRLQVFWDSLGTSRLDDWNATLTLPKNESEVKPNSGSAPGVLVLWVTGNYMQTNNPDTYKSNVYGKPASEEVTLTSIIPKLQWIKAAAGDTLITTGNGRQNKGSKWKGEPFVEIDRENNGIMKPVWVGEEIKLYLRAINGRTKKVCTTCNFDLQLTALAEGADAPNDKDANLIGSTNMNIKNGEAAFYIYGKKNVTDPSYAKLYVKGVSPLEEVVWDSLQFQEPPVPYPEHTWIYDDNGDGFGDRLVIAYSRGFHPDSLPNAIEVQWAKDTTIKYGQGIRTPITNSNDSAYSFTGLPGATSQAKREANLSFWYGNANGEKYIRLDSRNTNLESRRNITGEERKALRDTIILKRGPHGEPDVQFSKNVLTKSETGRIANWVSFVTGEGTPGQRAFDIGLPNSIDDKIPAIIVNARYLADENTKGCGTGETNACRDKLTLEFSEPVKIDPGAENSPENEIKNTFAYMLRDLGRNDWDILRENFLPTDAMMRYNNSKGMRPGENDSIVSLWFGRWRGEGENKSGTPMPGDSVKFASLGKGYMNFFRNILLDENNNPPNPNEIGRQIEGRKPFTPDKIPIGEIDPNYPDYYKEITKGTLDSLGSSGYDSLNLFNRDRPIELLPVPPDCDANCIRAIYPGTIGMVFNPDVFNELADLEDIHGPISDGDITIYPRAFIHTNLGNYVADRGFSVKCDDPIFPRKDNNPNNPPSCRDSRSKFYIAWDMKDMKGRFVGAGAYVGIYDFRWEVYIKKENRVEKKESIERKVEMHGVKRVKKR